MTAATSPGRDLRTSAWLLGVCSFVAYAYFFQGFGWNQNAHYATMRCIVEHGSPEITPLAGFTGDVSYAGDRIFSNKPPGLALLGTPFYFGIDRVERHFGLDVNEPRVVAYSQHLLSIVLCALPGAALVVMVYYALLRQPISQVQALGLAGAFAFGSLIWPYTGLLMSHVMTAALLLGAWLCITGDWSTRKIVLAGTLLGAAMLCEVLIWPASLLFVLYVLWRRSNLREVTAFAAGPLAACLILALYNRWAFGRIITIGILHTRSQFKSPDLFLGMFGWPDLRRLYWITFHPLRGMFLTTPLLLVPVLGLLRIFDVRSLRISADKLLALAIIAYHVLFEMCYYSWTGGYGTGIRFLVPVIALAYLFAPAGLRAMPMVSIVLLSVSVVMMLAITSVLVTVPANESGEPIGHVPIWTAMRNLMNGRVAQGEGAYNVGMLLGLQGPVSALPVIAVVAAFWIYVAVLAIAQRRAPTMESHDV